LARSGKSSQKNGRLQLRGRNRRLEHDGYWIAGASECHREAPILRTIRSRANPLQRLQHPTHRPPAQRCIAVEDRGDRTAGHRAQHEPTTGTGISEIKRPYRLSETVDTYAVDFPFALAATIGGGAKRHHGFSGIEHVVPF
jgi:hypothetical protein